MLVISVTDDGRGIDVARIRAKVVDRKLASGQLASRMSQGELLEFLFLTNDDDAKVLVDNRAHVLLANHVAAAIDTFMRTR